MTFIHVVKEHILGRFWLFIWSLTVVNVSVIFFIYGLFIGNLATSAFFAVVGTSGAFIIDAITDASMGRRKPWKWLVGVGIGIAVIGFLVSLIWPGGKR